MASRGSLGQTLATDRDTVTVVLQPEVMFLGDSGISSGPAVVNGMVIVGAGTGRFGGGQVQGIYGLALE